ncbi:unnamed protein product, partial [marine sediment metagenome]
EKVSIAQIMAEYAGIPRELAYDLWVYKQLWPLYVVMAESFRPEIRKLTGSANEIAEQTNKILTEEKTILELKRTQPIERPAASARTRKFVDVYQKLQHPELEAGGRINISALLW